MHGFSVTGAPVDPASTSNPLPMPAKWFYMLKDGTIATASATATPGTVTVTGATSANPIVGRVSFWTDDDTCKVNINTAAGDLWTPDTMSGTLTNPGSYMDMPHVNSTYDQNLAKYQPAKTSSSVIRDIPPRLTSARFFLFSPGRISGRSLLEPKRVDLPAARLPSRLPGPRR